MVKMSSCSRFVLKWLVPFLVVLYGLYHWHLMASCCRCRSDATLDGRTVIITGGNSGIGKETALDLARRGARVILACRSLQKAEEVAKEIKTRTGNSEVVVRHLDLSSLQSVREFAKRINESEERLDILINNAGVAFVAEGSVTEDNFHLRFGTNHFGHFLLTNLLLDLLKKSAPSRVVTLSSIGHRNPGVPLDFTRVDPTGHSPVLYPFLNDYFQSKLANVLFSRELARRLGPDGVTSVSLHPGVIYTSIWSDMPIDWRWTVYYHISRPFFWLFFMGEEAGAQTTLHCALDDSVPSLSGRYFSNCQEEEPSPLARDDDLARTLWDVSCQATGLQC